MRPLPVGRESEKGEIMSKKITIAVRGGDRPKRETRNYSGDRDPERFSHQADDPKEGQSLRALGVSRKAFKPESVSKTKATHGAKRIAPKPA